MAANDIPSYVDLGPIIKSPLDTNNYQAIELRSNGLKALLISVCDHPLEFNANDKNACPLKAIEQFNFDHLGIPKSSSTIPKNKTKAPSSKSQNPSRPHCYQHGEGDKVSGNKFFGVSLLVGSGMFDDNIPGMAHFIEHILFMSSKRYTEKEGFMRFVNINEGFANAGTYAEKTTYRFTVHRDLIDDALDWFVDLIINPRFSQKEIKDELHSMESEFQLRWTNEVLRYLGLLHYFGTRGHPFSRFGLGTRKDLDVKNIERICKCWKDRIYVTKNMVVAIQGPVPLEELANLVVQKFGKIVASPISPRDDIMKKFPPEQFPPFQIAKWNKCYHIIPPSADRLIRLTWWLPAKFGADYATKPLQFIGYLLDNQGPGGLINHLREQGWLISSCMRCPQADHMTTKFCSLFAITLYLTNKGFRERDEVVREVFFFILMLFNSCEEHLQRIFNEARQFHADAFHFKSDYNITDPGGDGVNFNFDPNTQANTLALLSEFLLDNRNPANLLTSFMLTTTWNGPLVKEALSFFLNPKNVNCLFGSKDFECDVNDEIWMGIRFSSHGTDHISDKRIYGVSLTTILEKPADNFLSRTLRSKVYNLPGPNLYIVRGQCGPLLSKPRTVSNEPRTILSNNKLDYKYYQSSCRKGILSTAQYYFELYSDTINEQSTEIPPKMQLFGKCIDQIFYFQVAHALSSLMAYQIEVKRNCVIFNLAGPSSMLPDIFEVFIKSLQNYETLLTPLVFDTMKETILTDQQLDLEDSEKYSSYLRKMIVDKHFVTASEVRSVFSNVTIYNFKEFITKVKDKMKLSLKIFGCVSQTHLDSVQRLLLALAYEAMTTESVENVAIRLPKGERSFRVFSRNPLDAHIYVTNHYQTGKLTKKQETILYAITHYLGTMAYIHLRTRKQIGYITSVDVDHLGSVAWLSVSLYGLTSRFTADYIDEAIDNFLRYFLNKVLRNRELYMDEVDPYLRDDITQEDVEDFYTKYFLSRGSGFKKLSMQILGFSYGRPKTGKKFGKKLEMKVKKYRNNPRIRLKCYRRAEYSLPKIIKEENGYFITDVEKFKRCREEFEFDSSSSGSDSDSGGD